MQAGTIVIINDLIGMVQDVKSDSYVLLCDDGEERTVKGSPTVVSKPHATALLYYMKLLERIRK